jgi:secondary thiamine-phosphate synthase enzyme
MNSMMLIPANATPGSTVAFDAKAPFRAYHSRVARAGRQQQSLPRSKLDAAGFVLENERDRAVDAVEDLLVRMGVSGVSIARAVGPRVTVPGLRPQALHQRFEPTHVSDYLWLTVHELSVSTHAREELVDITRQIQAELDLTDVNDGWCHIFVPHTTCGLAINEGADPDVRNDFLAHLRQLAPQNGSWRHAEGNADAHVKAILTGCDLTIAVAGGRLRLGRWQAVFLCEFDGPRDRSLLVSFQS